MKYNINQTHVLKSIEKLFAKQDKKLQDIQAKILSQIQHIEKLNFAQNCHVKKACIRLAEQEFQALAGSRKHFMKDKIW
ncbi:MAG: hypothetical protein LBJ88_01475 [Campylobacteraceae bacterium]|jgi:hypothetical protein|nr:hypothetical protein [Campylobacteraceae bacterium]